jgi:predicted transcriptional regulator
MEGNTLMSTESQTPEITTNNANANADVASDSVPVPTTAPGDVSPAVRAVGAFLGRTPGATAAELAHATGLGRSTVGKALTTLAKAGTAHREEATTENGQRIPDRWYPAVTEVIVVELDAAELAASAAQALPPADQTPTAQERLRPGQLHTLVLEYLTDHSGTEFTAPALSKVLERSSGAIANALARMARKGAVEQTCTAPKRYQVPAA